MSSAELKQGIEWAGLLFATVSEGFIMSVVLDPKIPEMDTKVKVEGQIRKINAEAKRLGVDVKGKMHASILKHASKIVFET